MEYSGNQQTSFHQSNASRITRKRNRHVFQACERCKKQKVRCNGKKPCDKCEKKRPGECFYISRHNFNAELQNSGTAFTGNGEGNTAVETSSKKEPPSAWNAALALHLTKMIQSQSEKLDLLLERAKVNGSSTNKSLLRDSKQYLPLNIEQHSTSMSYKQLLPFFRGPSGMTFYMSAVGMIGTGFESTDREAYSTPDGEIIVDYDSENGQSPLNHQEINYASTPATTEAQNGLPLSILKEIDKKMAVHLIHVYDGLVGVMHPILSIDSLIQHARGLYPSLATESHLPVRAILANQLSRSSLNIIKMVFAIAMLMEHSDNEDKAAKLYASIQRDVDNTIWAATAEIGDLQVLVLVSVYHSAQGNSRLAWRITGNLTRLILEFGLHKSKVLMSMFKEPSEYEEAIDLFWTAYVLDRQLSFSLGLPRHIQDKDVDSNIPLPGNSPYLTAMIDYCRLGSRICESISNAFGGSSHYVQEWRESVEYFQHDLNQWQDKHVSEVLGPNSKDIDSKRACHSRTILYLRANQLRLLSIRPALCSSQWQETANLDLWVWAIDVACDNIKTLLALFDRTNIYKMQQTQHNYFLITAFGALLGVLAQDRTSLSMEKVDSAALLKAREFVAVALDILKSSTSSSKFSEQQYGKVVSFCTRLGLLPTTPSGILDPLSDSVDFSLLHDVNGDVDISQFFSLDYPLASMWPEMDIA
ncbi:hypothetical protein V8C35DRAFT_328494 [Trichoderma chlorosporum]